MIDYEKSLPLIPNSDQINMIKPLNRRKYEDSSVDFPFSTEPNLKFLPSVDAEKSVEEARIERFEKGGV